MNTLWTFGDSFTFGHGCRPDGPDAEYYYNYKKNPDDAPWPDLLGKILNVKVKNFGRCGASNDFIIDSIIDNWDSFKTGDFVIIGITFHTRFDVPIKNKNKLSTNYLNYTDLINANEDNRAQIEAIVNFQYYFGDSELYKKRYLKRLNFIYKLIKEKNITTIRWDVPDFAGADRFEKIYEDTNGKIQDSHFSFKGNKDFADMMYDKIKTPQII